MIKAADKKSPPIPPISAGVFTPSKPFCPAFSHSCKENNIITYLNVIINIKFNIPLYFYTLCLVTYLSVYIALFYVSISEKY